MKHLLIAITTVAFLFLATSAHAKRISCKSFSTQAEAQAHHDAKKKGWKGLDRDKDGEACECLKGGSNYGESVCRSWRKKNGK